MIAEDRRWQERIAEAQERLDRAQASLAATRNDAAERLRWHRIRERIRKAKEQND